ncbi:MAG: uracil-DNA glycosylase [Candidatus Microsaccharimonas sp.]
METSQERIDQLAQEILAKDVCSELRVQASQLVMGDGDPNADIVFIGEAPGKKEDIEGKPFVGASGKFLNVMLEAAGMVRDDVYITNIVKYRPPGNRDPSEIEKAAFSPYLNEQIAIINPKVIITLGKHSLRHFLPDGELSELHGRPQQIDLNGREATLIPLYHPAYALYNGGNKQLLIDDFLGASKIAKEK